MEYHPVLKEMSSSHEKTWRDLKYILLNERSQQSTYRMTPNYTTFWKRQSYRGETSTSGCQGLFGEGEGEE